MNTRKLVFTTAMVTFTVFGNNMFVEAAKPGGPPDNPPDSEPAARAWHGFADNGSKASDSARIYLFGGAGSDARAMSDLWIYRAGDASRTLAPVGRSVPAARQHMGFSCGAGNCVAAYGSNLGTLRDSWVYTDASGIWSKVDCRRYACPERRQMPTSSPTLADLAMQDRVLALPAATGLTS